MEKILPIIFAILIIVACGVLLVITKKEASAPTITNFEECAYAGYPISDTYPKQCKTPDGKSFTKHLTVLAVEFQTPITLSINEQIKFGDGLEVTLVEINDSRCDPDVVCIWAGELSSRFILLGGNISQFKEVRLGTETEKTATHNNYTFTLQEATESVATIIVTNEDAPISCTMEARLCPDGSAVGRTGPNCEFAECSTVIQCAGPDDTHCPLGFECTQECGPPVAREDDSPPPYSCQLKRSNRLCPICLAKNTLIDTPHGSIPVQDLEKGKDVWTIDTFGNRVLGVVIETSKTKVPFGHKMVALIMEDGRTLYVSPLHPTTDGHTARDLIAGDFYDNARIVSALRVSYNEKYTYDILPDGDTGFYFANGIIFDSTLHLVVE